MEDFRWIYQEDKPQVAEVAADLQTGTNPRRFSANRNYRKDGSVVHCEWYNSALLDASGNLRSVLSLVLDVTERKRAEEALQEAQAKLQAHTVELEKTVASRTAKLRETITELQHFSYAITHDMRAPLRAMQGFADLLEAECGGCERTTSQVYFRRINIASARMDQLITDSLNYSKVACQELTLEPVDVFQLLDGLVETYPNLQPDKADIEIQPELPIVLGNQAALTQCFSNLLDNAVKFAKPGTKPQIRVWAEALRDGGRGALEGEASERGAGEGEHAPNSMPQALRVRVWVEDNGVGIAKESLQRIFGMFQRAAINQEGTGIGLAIVRKVAQRMGGEVGVESEEGEGSRFWVELAKAP
jgi:signal transduction histidine kinase